MGLRLQKIGAAPSEDTLNTARLHGSAPSANETDRGAMSVAASTNDLPELVLGQY